jgi:hypothetical protein
MTRNALYALVGAATMGAAVIGYLLYQERQTNGLEISIGNGSLTIKEN